MVVQSKPQQRSGSSLVDLPPRSFRLDESFLERFRARKPEFGFGLVGEMTFRRTYSRRRLDDPSKMEEWHDTIQRVVEGTFSILLWHLRKNEVEFSMKKMRKRAERMYEYFFEMRCLPPGRGLWVMGTDIVHKKGLGAALQNCAFISTEKIGERHGDPSAPFRFLMNASMLGVGTGADTKGAGKVVVLTPLPEYHEENIVPYVIGDSREGWVDSTGDLILSYLRTDGVRQRKIVFDYTQIRKKGEVLGTFGGLASGPQPLIDLHEAIRAVLDPLDGEMITVRAIVDMFNLIGKAVIAGNVRRTAEIMFGGDDDDEFLNLKNYEQNPERSAYGWASNNSVFASPSTDYEKIAERIRVNGEPGLAWLDNMRAYGRMSDPADYRDHRVSGANPCVEQSLESEELCNLGENFLNRHDGMDLEDFLKTLETTFMYCKIVTLVPTGWSRTDEIMQRNRRIGCSITGVAQFLTNHSLETLRQWCDLGYKHLQDYDRRLSRWLNVPTSIKITSVKPSGSVSLLGGATPGMHWPLSREYIRRVTLDKQSNMLVPLLNAGYTIEESNSSPQTSCVVEMPVRINGGVRTCDEVSMFEQLALASFLQRYYSDNQVSATITFNPETEGRDIRPALEFYQYNLKGVSFLPLLAKGAYPQMPYSAITPNEYDERAALLKPVNWSDTVLSEGVKIPWEVVLETPDSPTHTDGRNIDNDETPDASLLFCDGDSCTR